MKLNIAENIRKLRRQRDLTQEQLAEKLGVSFQTVSRWETEVVYPDIELLPQLAQLFDVTVDELIGCDKNAKQERANKLWELVCCTDSPEEKYAYLMQIREEFRHEWRASVLILHLIYENGFHKDDMRDIAVDVLQNCTDGDFRREAFYYYTALEEEAYITEEFLSKHAGGDFDKAFLLSNRYLYRKEWEKYEVYRKRCLLYQLDDMFTWGLRTKLNLDAEKSVSAQKIGLSIINSMCEITPTYPVSGDGVVDLWTEYRIWMGLRLSCALASTDNKEQAFVTLEDTVTLIERLISAADGTTLTYRSHSLEGISGVISRKRFEYGEKEAYVSCDGDDLLYGNAICLSVPNVLTRKDGWEWFDPIRNDERYISLSERLAVAQAKLEASVK